MLRGIDVSVSPEDRERLSGLVPNQNTPQKHAAQTDIVVLTGVGLSTMEIMRRKGKSKQTRSRQAVQTLHGPGFEAELVDMVGLNVAPPDRVLVLSID